MESSESARRRPKRPLRAVQHPPDAGCSSEHAGGSTSGQQTRLGCIAAPANGSLGQLGEDGRFTKRRREVAQPAYEARCSNSIGASAAERPTAAERCEALDVIQQMKAADPPLLAKRAPAKPEFVACAIALWRGEQFTDDRAALRLFKAHPETKIREKWIQKLDQFAPAGFGTTGPALPAYLLDRMAQFHAECEIRERSRVRVV